MFAMRRGKGWICFSYASFDVFRSSRKLLGCAMCLPSYTCLKLSFMALFGFQYIMAPTCMSEMGFEHLYS